MKNAAHREMGGVFLWLEFPSYLPEHAHAGSHNPVGAAEGCDLLILLFKNKIKRSSDRGPSLRQLLHRAIMREG
ncbi:hypothetical protein ACXR0M_08305 [Pseudomonas sp. Eth.TT006]